MAAGQDIRATSDSTSGGATGGSQPSAGASAARRSLMGGLAGLDFSTQAARLSPRDGRPVQLERKDGPKEAPSPEEPAPGPGADAKKAPTEGKLDPGQLDKALRYNRKRAIARAPERLALTQKALGVPQTRIMDDGTAQGTATFQEGSGLKVDGKLGPETEQALAPALAKLEPPPRPLPPAAEPAPAKAAARPAPAPAPEAAAKKEAPSGEVLADKSKTHAAADAKREQAAAEGKPGAPGAQKGPARAKGPLSRDDWETVPPEERAKTDGPLSNKALMEALGALAGMPRRLDPDWIVAAQSALGVPASGAFSRAFMQAVAKFQADRMGMKKPDGRLDKPALREALKGAFPDLAKLPELFSPGALKKSDKDMGASRTLFHDRVLADSGCGAKSWAEWASQMAMTPLCGHSVNGHPLFLERVQAAEAYLENKFGLKGAALGKATGVSTVTSIRPPAGDWARKAGYHTFGFALDIDPSNNPWIMRKDPKHKAGDELLSAVTGRAATLLGYGQALSAADVAQKARELPTDELYEFMQRSNVALRDYRNLRGKDKEIQKVLANASEAARKLGDASWWAKQIADDDKALSTSGKSPLEGQKNKGFMTMREEVVVALRDIGGLTWGACDFGTTSGDMMHFDARRIGLADRINRMADVHLAKYGRPPLKEDPGAKKG